MELNTLKTQILKLTQQYAQQAHSVHRPAKKASEVFVAGETIIPYAGRVFESEEVVAAVDACLDFWLTLGVHGKAFETGLAKFLGAASCVLTNSGSSANLLAISALTSHKLSKERRLLPGDEVITCAAGFPTTVAPIIQNGLIPIFLDNDPITGNARLDALEAAYVPNKTKAIMMAHTLGNPFDLATVVAFCRKHNLWLIEDNCDALGSTYWIAKEHPLYTTLTQRSQLQDDGLERCTGAWGDLSTQSFYPPHHLTLGEGGAVNIVSERRLKRLVESFRDWGRDCWCESGQDNTCTRRFGWQLGELPYGYDHKYIYSHLGYNLKPLDLQAAIGIQQLKRLPEFVQARCQNWHYLRKGLADLESVFEFSLPTHATGWTSEGFQWSDTCYARSNPSWFGFMLRLRPEVPFKRVEFVQYLSECKIGNRMLFGGNLVRQPAFVQLKKDRPESFRVMGDLAGADALMHHAVFIGTYPGLAHAMLDYIIERIHAFVANY